MQHYSVCIYLHSAGLSGSVINCTERFCLAREIDFFKIQIYLEGQENAYFYRINLSWYSSDAVKIHTYTVQKTFSWMIVWSHEIVREVDVPQNSSIQEVFKIAVDVQSQQSLCSRGGAVSGSAERHPSTVGPTCAHTLIRPDPRSIILKKHSKHVQRHWRSHWELWQRSTRVPPVSYAGMLG